MTSFNPLQGLRWLQTSSSASKTAAIRVSIRFRVRGGSKLNSLSPAMTALFQSASGFAVVPDPGCEYCTNRKRDIVSIRFRVRGGSRQYCDNVKRNMKLVSIRFRVRGGSRPRPCARCSLQQPFQSASGFAVVPDTRLMSCL